VLERKAEEAVPEEDAGMEEVDPAELATAIDA